MPLCSNRFPMAADSLIQSHTKIVPVDLDQPWTKLGIQMKDGSVAFDDKAPEANIRKTHYSRAIFRSASAMQR